MNHDDEIEFSWQGLRVTATISEYIPGFHLIAPEGGECIDWEWEVENIDEVLDVLDLGEDMNRLVVEEEIAGRGLPIFIRKKIEKWDFETIAEEQML